MSTFQPDKGDSLWAAVVKAKIFAKDQNGPVEMIFNGIKLVVDQDSLDHDIAEIYRLKRKCGEHI